MTLREVSSQLYSLSVAGYFNGEKFTKSQLTEAMSHWMRTRKSYIGEIALPDGRWFFEVTNYGGGYDYYIPETRQQNDALRNRLLGRSA